MPLGHGQKTTHLSLMACILALRLTEAAKPHLTQLWDRTIATCAQEWWSGEIRTRISLLQGIVLWNTDHNLTHVCAM